MCIRDSRYFAHDNVQLALGYEDGSIAQITYTAMGAPSHPKERVVVHSGGWTYTVDDYRSLIVKGPSIVKGPRERVIEYRGTEKGHKEELELFSNWLRGETPPPIDLSSMLETTLATFTAYEQIRGG